LGDVIKQVIQRIIPIILGEQQEQRFIGVVEAFKNRAPPIFNTIGIINNKTMAIVVTRVFFSSPINKNGKASQDKHDMATMTP
jgi:hypothetical protein